MWLMIDPLSLMMDHMVRGGSSLILLRCHNHYAYQSILLFPAATVIVSPLFDSGDEVYVIFVNEAGYYYASSGTGIGVAVTSYYDLDSGMLREEEESSSAVYE